MQATSQPMLLVDDSARHVSHWSLQARSSITVRKERNTFNLMSPISVDYYHHCQRENNTLKVNGSRRPLQPSHRLNDAAIVRVVVTMSFHPLTL